MSRILVAMSGGVDSSIAAYLLNKEGHRVKGVMLKLFEDSETSCSISNRETAVSRTCCSAEDSAIARSVAANIGIDFFVFNYKKAFEKEVVERFVSGYLAGETPNPCIDCNKYIKFGELYKRLDGYDAEAIATGHYARIMQGSSGRWSLKKALDSNKDQSYVLYSLTQEQLARTYFPLGELTKLQVREIAAECGFINSDKPDSQDICFVPDGDYAGFIERRTGRKTPEGEFVDSDGNVLGRHKGALRYTIGQRRGIGIAFNTPKYVVNIDSAKNQVQIGDESELYSSRLTAHELNLIAFDKINAPIKASARIRYNGAEHACVIHQTGLDEVIVEFDAPQRAITRGQAVVFYDGEEVLGGGVIG